MDPRPLHMGIGLATAPILAHDVFAQLEFGPHNQMDLLCTLVLTRPLHFCLLPCSVQLVVSLDRLQLGPVGQTWSPCQLSLGRFELRHTHHDPLLHSGPIRAAEDQITLRIFNIKRFHRSLP